MIDNRNKRIVKYKIDYKGGISLQKTKRKSKMFKVISIIVAILIVLAVVSTVLIGNYFVDYTLLRSGDGGNRTVKEGNAINYDEDKLEDLIEKNKSEALEVSKNWAGKIYSKKVEIKSNDDIMLRGTEYITSSNSNKWLIVLHGYRSTPSKVLPTAQKYADKGYNILVPSLRGCGESDGEYIGMGCLDKEDLKLWINLVIKDNPESEIVLHGYSMGAATVLMVSGDELPPNVKAIVEDSGYTTVWDIFSSEAKVRFGIPEFPVMYMMQLMTKIRAGYDIKSYSSLQQVKNSNIPTLFIHGTVDDFVPTYMLHKLYEAAICEKEKLLVKGAGHTDSMYVDSEVYFNKVFGFLSKYVK